LFAFDTQPFFSFTAKTTNTMTIASITQKRLWQRSAYQLKEEFLHCQERTGWNSMELDLPYEEISRDKFVYQQYSNNMIAAMAVLWLLSLGNVLGIVEGAYAILGWPVLLGSSAALYVLYQQGQAVIRLGRGSDYDLLFFCDPKHQTKAEQFVEALLEKQRTFLLDKYWHCIDDLDEKLDYLEWLKNRNVIDLDTFKSMRRAAGYRSSANALPIGFHKEDRQEQRA
jgi:hypothetical protein